MPSKTSSKKNNGSFEELITELETLVNSLEKGDLPLEESLATFEKGIKLTKECQKHLSEAEQKVSLLTANGENLEISDFKAREE